MLVYPVLVLEYQSRVLWNYWNYLASVRSVRALGYSGILWGLNKGVVRIQAAFIWTPWAMCTIMFIRSLAMAAGDLLPLDSFTASCSICAVPLVGVVLYTCTLWYERRMHPVSCEKELMRRRTNGWSADPAWGEALFTFDTQMCLFSGVVLWQAVTILCLGMFLDGIIPNTERGVWLSFSPVWLAVAALVLAGGCHSFVALIIRCKRMSNLQVVGSNNALMLLRLSSEFCSVRSGWSSVCIRSNAVLLLFKTMNSMCLCLVIDSRFLQ